MKKKLGRRHYGQMKTFPVTVHNMYSLLDAAVNKKMGNGDQNTWSTFHGHILQRMNKFMCSSHQPIGPQPVRGLLDRRKKGTGNRESRPELQTAGRKTKIFLQKKRSERYSIQRKKGRKITNTEGNQTRNWQIRNERQRKRKRRRGRSQTV